MNLAMYRRYVTALLALGQRSLVHTNFESAVPLKYIARRMAKALLGWASLMVVMPVSSIDVKAFCVLPSGSELLKGVPDSQIS